MTEFIIIKGTSYALMIGLKRNWINDCLSRKFQKCAKHFLRINGRRLIDGRIIDNGLSITCIPFQEIVGDGIGNGGSIYELGSIGREIDAVRRGKSMC